MQNTDVAAQLLHMFHAVRGKHNDFPLVAERFHRIFEQFHIYRIKAAERFVQNEDLRVVNDGGDKLDFLLIALRQFLDFLAVIFGNTESLQPILQAAVGFFAAHAFQLSQISAGR